MDGMSTHDHRAKSGLHMTARALLLEKYPTLSIIEEVTIPILSRGQVGYLDFYIPLLKKAYEVHGEQHYSYTGYFHGSIAGFRKHKQRDIDKEAWCELNGIELVVLPYHEIENWSTSI